MFKPLDWLDGLPRYSQLNFNLYRIWLLLNRVVPEYTELNVFFVTGSKGKGTVAATLAAILRCAEIGTGLLTSPHLVNVTERVNYNDGDISGPELANCLEEIKRQMPKLPAQYGSWIHSEVILAAALLWFRKKGANTVVLEAGLGGRLDAGNVFRRPLATCISTVTLEHQGILGNTLREIALEKAGVIKPGVPVVTGAKGPALAIISSRAKTFAAPVLAYGKDFYMNPAELHLPSRIIPLSGKFDTQADEINRTMAACLAIHHSQVTDQAVIEGISAPALPGRFEVYPGQPAYVLDVAHTPEAVANLVEGIARRFPARRIAFVAGFLADKAIEDMMGLMLSVSPAVFFAPVEDKRSFDAVTVDLPGTNRAQSISAAVGEAAAQADVICVTGSFSAVREARILLSNRF